MGDFSLKIYPTKAVKISLPAQGRNFSDKKVITGNRTALPFQGEFTTDLTFFEQINQRKILSS